MNKIAINYIPGIPILEYRTLNSITRSRMASKIINHINSLDLLILRTPKLSKEYKKILCISLYLAYNAYKHQSVQYQGYAGIYGKKFVYPTSFVQTICANLYPHKVKCHEEHALLVSVGVLHDAINNTKLTYEDVELVFKKMDCAKVTTLKALSNNYQGKWTDIIHDVFDYPQDITSFIILEVMLAKKIHELLDLDMTLLSQDAINFYKKTIKETDEIIYEFTNLLGKNHSKPALKTLGMILATLNMQIENYKTIYRRN